MAHAPALGGHPDLDFAGVWGRRPGAAKELAELHGTRAYDDVEELFADVDAVAVALPPAGGGAQPSERVMSTIQGMPKRSVHIPNTSPHICLSSGTDTEPPADSLSQ